MPHEMPAHRDAQRVRAMTPLFCRSYNRHQQRYKQNQPYLVCSASAGCKASAVRVDAKRLLFMRGEKDAQAC